MQNCNRVEALHHVHRRACLACTARSGGEFWTYLKHWTLVTARSQDVPRTAGHELGASEPPAASGGPLTGCLRKPCSLALKVPRLASFGLRFRKFVRRPAQKTRLRRANCCSRLLEDCRSWPARLVSGTDSLPAAFSCLCALFTGAYPGLSGQQRRHK